MKLLLSNGTIIDVKYCVDNHGSLYYQRGIPKDLQSRFGNQVFKIKLDPHSSDSIARQVQNLAASHNALFRALRKNPRLVASEQKLASLSLLQKYKLHEGDARILDFFASDKQEEVDAIDRNQVDNITDFLSDYTDKEGSGKLTATDELAHQILFKPLPMVVSEALLIYFKNHPKGRDPEYKRSVSIHWDKLVNLIGDITLVGLTRSHARY